MDCEKLKPVPAAFRARYAIREPAEIFGLSFAIAGGAGRVSVELGPKAAVTGAVQSRRGD
jgi:hypothetical protein